ncbi:hypothetical protein [Arthrobacter sp. MA-N2]|uniref:hypothetical protein n=1 Tax=Arthrobacter sp. MA-N2 TaxID=1101188 RepID=UPI0004B6432F|nr:hypothetical protein [Arthrobacter sp. MA-N2]
MPSPSPRSWAPTRSTRASVPPRWHQRFTHEDLLSIFNTAGGKNHTTSTRTVTDDQGQWLSQGTSGWANFGTAAPAATAPATTSDEDFEGATE